MLVIRGLLLWHSHPFHNVPLLRITDARGVQPIGELIGGACGVMPHKSRGEVLKAKSVEAAL